MYTHKEVRKLLRNYPSLVEVAQGTSATSYSEKTSSGVGGKLAAQRKEELLCCVVDLEEGIDTLSPTQQKIIVREYILKESRKPSASLDRLVRNMNGES